MATDYNYNGEEAWLLNAQNRYLYKFKKNDVTIYPATELVHAAIENTSDRFPEEVKIFNSDDEYKNDAETALTYSVRKGKSIL